VGRHAASAVKADPAAQIIASRNSASLCGGVLIKQICVRFGGAISGNCTTVAIHPPN
jgi:hypothetical protein